MVDTDMKDVLWTKYQSTQYSQWNVIWYGLDSTIAKVLHYNYMTWALKSLKSPTTQPSI